MPTATVTSKGQITIPLEVRKSLKLKAGDKIDFYETEAGKYAFQPKAGSIMDMQGILQKMGYAPLGYAPSLEEMDEAIADYVSELDRETMSDHTANESDDQVA
jgi:AbrB family looped-hinge helix DNA binding protein